VSMIPTLGLLVPVHCWLVTKAKQQTPQRRKQILWGNLGTFPVTVSSHERTIHRRITHGREAAVQYKFCRNEPDGKVLRCSIGDVADSSIRSRGVICNWQALCPWSWMTVLEISWDQTKWILQIQPGRQHGCLTRTNKSDAIVSRLCVNARCTVAEIPSSNS